MVISRLIVVPKDRNPPSHRQHRGQGRPAPAEGPQAEGEVIQQVGRKPQTAPCRCDASARALPAIAAVVAHLSPGVMHVATPKPQGNTAWQGMDIGRGGR